MHRTFFSACTLVVFIVLTACTPVVQLNSNQQSGNEHVNAAAVNTVANVNVAPNTNVAPAQVNANTSVAAFVSPMDRRTERVTKKMYGTYITPKTSPIQPERFTGYHTGLDYETFANEAKTDVPVVAACTGKVHALQTVSGYGGVLVQQCVVAGQAVTALYGHVRLSSISVKVGSTLKAGSKFSVLGTGYSSETSGERKHLHFSLHKGTTIVWKGYVSSKRALVDWLDPLRYLPKN